MSVTDFDSQLMNKLDFSDINCLDPSLKWEQEGSTTENYKLYFEKQFSARVVLRK
jgi:hypothetical protein